MKDWHRAADYWREDVFNPRTWSKLCSCGKPAKKNADTCGDCAKTPSPAPRCTTE